MTAATLRHAGWILRGNPLTAVAAAGVLLLALIAIFGPWIVPYDPIVSNVSQALMPPSAAHIAGIVFSTMLGANVLVEKVFSWPGVASYALDALLSSDYAPVQGFVLLMATVFVIVNLLVDILYGIADPRVTIG